MQLGLLDGIIFLGYFFGVVIFGVVIAARNKSKTAESYFLASKKLPWYAVGASFVASNISTEHFIGMIGWSFIYGMAIANWAWMNVFTFTMLIWVFLPFYMRGNVATMPEFLERRYNRFCRYVYAVVQIVGLVIALLGGVLFAGAKAINVFFPNISVTAAILILAIAAGTYTIYGGLLSTVWADFLQYCLLMVGGLVVSIYGLTHVGGLGELLRQVPEKFITFYPADHEIVPWTGLAFGVFTVGLWYSCANQFMVQRCLGARSEWDARMGVVMAGFSQAFLPLIVVIPGIAAFLLFQHQISDGDKSWPFMVKLFLPTGFVGLVLAGLASAIMSTLAAITNSSATILTLDLYKPILKSEAGDRELHLVGRLSGALVMVVGVIIALILASRPGVTVFGLIQTVFFYLAPPISAAFLLGIIWRRITPMAASWGMALGFGVYLPLVVFGIYHNSWACAKLPFLDGFHVDWLKPYNSFMHHTFTVFVFSVVTMLLVSTFTRPKSPDALKGVIWSRSALGLDDSERDTNRGTRGLGLWWGLMAVTIFSLYAVTIWKSSRTDWLEAEKINFAASDGRVGIQRKGSLEGFTMWTGHGQVLFEPHQAGDRLIFELPIEHEGRFEIHALITMGPEYGLFKVRVNDRPTTISYTATTFDEGTGDYQIVEFDTEIFDARELHEIPVNQRPPESIASEHVMQRITLGGFGLSPDASTITLVAVPRDDGSLGQVGVDQWILNRIDLKQSP